MTGRAIPEWIADHPDQAIPARVKVRILERFNTRCAITGTKLRPGAYEFDHIVPLSMKGGHRESNLHPILTEKHREKTAAEAGVRAKADRIRAKHLGVWPKSKRPLQSRGFDSPRATSKEN